MWSVAEPACPDAVVFDAHWRGRKFMRRAGIFGGRVIADGYVFGFAILGGVVRLLLTGGR